MIINKKEKIRADILTDNNSEIHFCKCCKTNKDKNSYYSYSYFIDNYTYLNTKNK